MHAVFEQAIARTRILVINRVRLVYTPDYIQQHQADSDEMYRCGMSLSNDITEQLLGGAPMLSNFMLAELAGKVTLEELFTCDGWVEGVTMYICAHADECTPVWDTLRAMVDQEAK